MGANGSQLGPQILERANGLYPQKVFENDDNLTENNIRLISPGKQNYLFAGNHKAAQCSVVIHCLGLLQSVLAWPAGLYSQCIKPAPRPHSQQY
jgi:hypothetical protein